MYSVTVADHMMVAHSLRGEAFGPAQALHGATYVVEATFRRDDLDPDGIVVDIGLGTLGPHAAGITAVAVTLRENPLAWASYERAP